MSDKITAANRALLRRFYRQVYVDWDMALVDEVVSPEFISHDWPEGCPRGPQAFRQYYAAIRAAVSNARYEVDDLIAEDDRVVVRWRLLGTHEGYFRGIAPTGKEITLEGIAIYRVDGGKLMERWVVSDLYGLLEDLRPSSTRDHELRAQEVDSPADIAQRCWDSGCTVRVPEDGEPGELIVIDRSGRAISLIPRLSEYSLGVELAG